VNLIGEKSHLTASAEQPPAGRPSGSCLLTTAAFPVFVALSYGRILGGEPNLAAMLVSTVLYFAAIYFFFGIAELACERRTYLLWITAVAAYVIGFSVAGLSFVWPMLTGCSMFLFGGVIVGRLCDRGQRPGRVYILGAAAVLLFFSAQFASLWGFLMDQTRAAVPQVMGEWEAMLRSMGATPEYLQDSLTQAEKIFAILVRLIPALTLLGALVEFSLGFLVFAYVINRRRPWLDFWPPFSRWRVPFGFTPVVAVTVLARLLGNDTTQLVADNILAVLAVYYSVAGLALIEYYMNKLALPRLMKPFVYVLLTLTPFIGPRPLTAAAVLGVMILLGFVDSFTDWRKEPPAVEAA
jgi:uncharacterized protein YybS (DUF2232 family)